MAERLDAERIEGYSGLPEPEPKKKARIMQVCKGFGRGKREQRYVRPSLPVSLLCVCVEREWDEVWIAALFQAED
jgi:hypothetical protein